jgi:Tfp pilus assembly PilM family ATPase
MRSQVAASSYFTPSPPSVAIEIAHGRVGVAAVGRSGGQLVVSAYATERLPEGAVTPALTGSNVADPTVVAAALRQALDKAGLRSPGRAALIVPDSTTRVSLVTLEQVPARASDLDKLIRWQMKKATPFPIDDAQVSHFVAHTGEGGSTLAALVARRDVIAEYEAVTDALGIHAGIVDLASFSVMNAVIGAGAASAGDWLMVHLAAEATTLAILRGPSLMFYRHRLAVDEEPLGALVHQTAMYHEDRLGGGRFERVWLSGAGALGPDALQRVRGELAERLGATVETVDVRPGASLRDRVNATPDVLDTLAAPVGMLLREQEAA